MNFEFETTGRVCVKHQQPAGIICLNRECRNVACCPDCVRNDHPHPRQLISFIDLAKLLPKTIAEKGKNLTVPNSTVFSKVDFENQQNNLLDNLRRKLADQKRRIYQELDKLQESTQKTSDPKSEPMKNIANYDYFVRLLAPKLIELKIACSNEQGINIFRDKMIQLHLIGQKEYETAKEYRKIKESTWRRMRGLISQGIASNISKIISTQNLPVPELKKREKSLQPERGHQLATSKVINKSENRSPSPRKKIISCRKL